MPQKVDEIVDALLSDNNFYPEKSEKQQKCAKVYCSKKPNCQIQKFKTRVNYTFLLIHFYVNKFNN
jgi:hypothetical protein